MNYYKDTAGKVHAIEGEFKHLLPEGCVEITKEEADAISNPPPGPEQIISSFTSEIQKRLDAFARTRNYDGILSACTYATSLIPKFKAEGQYAVEARDNTWASAYELLAEVEAGTRPMPTLDEVIAALPELVWPQ